MLPEAYGLWPSTPSLSAAFSMFMQKYVLGLLHTKYGYDGGFVFACGTVNSPLRSGALVRVKRVRAHRPGVTRWVALRRRPLRGHYNGVRTFLPSALFRERTGDHLADRLCEIITGNTSFPPRQLPRRYQCRKKRHGVINQR
jgi:hypothetical protein